MPGLDRRGFRLAPPSPLGAFVLWVTWGHPLPMDSESRLARISPKSGETLPSGLNLQAGYVFM